VGKRADMESSIAKLIYLLRSLNVIKRNDDRVLHSTYYFPRMKVETYLARMIKMQGRY